MSDADHRRSEAFRALADEHLRDAYDLAYAVLRDQGEARDAVHDAFITAWERWADLRDPARFEAWFKRILVNTCKNRLTRASRRPTSELDTSTGPISADPTEQIHDRAVLGAAMATLSADDRVVLALRYYRDLRIEDIAAVLEIPPNTATSRLHRAHERLRTALAIAGVKGSSR